MIIACNDNDNGSDDDMGGERSWRGRGQTPPVLTSTERRVQSMYLLLAISSCGDAVTAAQR
jgi:hypothetical protein